MTYSRVVTQCHTSTSHKTRQLQCHTSIHPPTTYHNLFFFRQTDGTETHITSVRREILSCHRHPLSVGLSSKAQDTGHIHPIMHECHGRRHMCGLTDGYPHSNDVSRDHKTTSESLRGEKKGRFPFFSFFLSFHALLEMRT